MNGPTFRNALIVQNVKIWNGPECHHSGIVQNVEILEWSKKKKLSNGQELKNSGMETTTSNLEWPRIWKLAKKLNFWNIPEGKNSWSVYNVKILDWLFAWHFSPTGLPGHGLNRHLLGIVFAMKVKSWRKK